MTVNADNTPSSLPSQNWDANQVRRELREAITDLRERGLKVAAKFASEQLIGMVQSDNEADLCSHKYKHENQFHTPDRQKDGSKNSVDGELPLSTPRDKDGNSINCMQGEMDNRHDDEIDKLLFAQVLFDSGEFERAANILSERNQSEGRYCGEPLKCLSSKGIFLRGYSLYLSGERRKEEEILELR